MSKCLLLVAVDEAATEEEHRRWLEARDLEEAKYGYGEGAYVTCVG